MYQKLVLVALGGAVALGAVAAWQTAPAQQRPPDKNVAPPAEPPALLAAARQVPEANGPRKTSAQLPISQVVLFSSGVGYFQREGEVDGSTRVDLSFQIQDINDLLKSMILQDTGGGRISTVNYDSQEPIDKTLRSFAINLTNNPTFGEILNQCRGEKVEVVLQSANTTQPGTLTGVVLGMEEKTQPGVTGSVELLNLSCAEGLRSIKLHEIVRVRLLNPALDSELKRALEVLAMSHDAQKKAVSLLFAGEGKRKVRVGYVIENPLWKTSYRLVLDQHGKPFLQGWAVVENTSDDDWTNVRMSLVSGRPISFQMDLYQPLYLPRPTVEPEHFASLRPPTYNGAITPGPGNLGGAPDPAQAMNPALVNPQFMAGNRYQRGAQFGFQGGQFGLQGGFGGFAGGANLGFAGGGGNLGIAGGGANPGIGGAQLGFQGQGRLTFEEYQNRKQGKLEQVKAQAQQQAQVILNPTQGVASAATAEEIGDFFQYQIDQPVTLPRQKSALLPIVNKPVEGTKVSIYNESVQTKFPLLGLKMKNTSGHHLMQGPISVYEGGSYAGDARLMDLQPNEERLLSYAIDLGTEVKPESRGGTEQMIAVKVVKGIVRTTHKFRETKAYLVKNRSEHDRALIIEHPIRTDWNLVTPEKASERSRDVYRFQLNVPAGKTAMQEVVEEQTTVNQVALSNSNDQAVRLLLRSTIPSQAVKDALEKAIDLRVKAAATQRAIAEAEKQLKSIAEDQERLRANMGRLPSDSAAYKRYLKKFDDQETEIEKLQEQAKQFKEKFAQQQEAYESFLIGLTVE